MAGDGSENGGDLGGNVRTPRQRLAKIMNQLIPPRPRACFHCERLMIPCIYGPDREVCRSCLVEGRYCYEDRKLRWGPAEHQLIRELAHDGELVDLVSRKAVYWDMHDRIEAGFHYSRTSSFCEDLPTDDENGNDRYQHSPVDESLSDTIPPESSSSRIPEVLLRCELDDAGDFYDLLDDGEDDREDYGEDYGEDDGEDDMEDDMEDDPETTDDAQDQSEGAQVEYAMFGFELFKPWNASSAAPSSSMANPGTPPAPQLDPEEWVLFSWPDGNADVGDELTWESNSAERSRSQSPSALGSYNTNYSPRRSATPLADLHEGPKSADSFGRVEDFRAHSSSYHAPLPSQEYNASEDIPRLGPVSHVYDERWGEWYPIAADNGVVSSSMTMGEVTTVLTDHGCVDLTDKLRLDKCSNYPVSTGGFGDVYSGRLTNGSQVAIKISRLHPIHNQTGEALQQVAKELHTWSKCQHLNVLELLGFAEFRERLGMVSLWMENGSAPDYLSHRSDIDRCQLCYGISDGLAYLHGVKIVHGDLKGANVLVSGDGTPKLTDFGNSVLQNSSVQYTNANPETTISVRWTAPEILGGKTTHSYSGDVFALGMTLLEIITGAPPYRDLRNEGAIIMAIAIARKFPERLDAHIPTGSEHGDTFWSLLTECWTYEPEGRPSAAEVRDRMKGITCEGLKGSAYFES